MIMQHTYSRNEAIFASAGTGKTYNLSMRYIRLLLQGMKPSSIVALTFSNKAAGEILESIIKQLINLATKPAELAKAIPESLPDGTDREQIIDQLRKLLAGTDRPNVSTIDSFFLQIVRTCPLECGLSGDVTMLNENDDRPRVLALMKVLQSLNEDQHRNLMELIKQASYGDEKRSLMQTMKNDILGGYFPKYLDYPDPEWWLDNQKELWREYDPANLLSKAEIGAIRDAFTHKIRTVSIPEANPLTDNDIVKFCDRVRKLADDAECLLDQHQTGSDLKTTIEFIQKLGKPEQILQSGSYFIYYAANGLQRQRAGAIQPLDADRIRKLILHILTREFQYVSERTSALFQLLYTYNNVYTKTVREIGKLVFQDIPLLLRGKKILDQTVIGERLDAEFDHYMIDEFQDTSNIQWEILKPLIDEVVSNEGTGRNRSLFLVGDCKQSIYQFRSGNPKLFKMVCNDYKFEEKRDGCKDQPDSLLRNLRLSYRSSKPIIECVNDTFGSVPENIPALSALRLAWEDFGFQDHESEPYRAANLPGCSMLLDVTLTKDEISSGQDMTHKAKIICDILHEIKPFDREKPYSVAILVQRNDIGLALKEAIQTYASDLPVTLDGRIRASDSMVFTIFRQLLRHAAHPGDTLASGFLNMLEIETPGDVAERLFPGSGNTLSAAIRDEIEAHGFEAFAGKFARILPELGLQDTQRLKIIRNAALQADLENIRSIDEFLDFLALNEGNQCSVSRTIQIMTIHKSKGLTFDIVFLPENGKDKRGTGSIIDSDNRSKFIVGKEKQSGSPRFVSCTPPKDLEPYFSGFSRHRFEADADTAYESLCKLYVAVTRAKHAMYIMADDTGRDMSWEKPVFEDVLRETLETPFEDEQQTIELKKAGLNETDQVTLRYLSGSPDWFRTTDSAPYIAAPVAKQEPVILRFENVCSAPRITTPSGTHENIAHWRFEPITGATAGTTLHQAMEKFDWYTTPEQAADFVSSHPVTQPLFQSAEICNALQKPEGDVLLWRERSFLIRQKDGSLCRGTFDRVVIRMDGKRPVSAEIFDYKTDKCTTSDEFRKRYTAQMTLYRDAVMRMLDLPQDTVRCTILAMTPGTVIPVI